MKYWRDNKSNRNSQLLDGATDEMIESFISQMIEDQKQITLSPFVKTRIMSKVEEISNRYENKMKLYLRVAYYLCFAVTILSSVYLGRSLGESYPMSVETNVYEHSISSSFYDDGFENKFLIQTR